MEKEAVHFEVKMLVCLASFCDKLSPLFCPLSTERQAFCIWRTSGRAGFGPRSFFLSSTLNGKC